MTLQELIDALSRQGVQPRAYDLEGTSRDEVYCLDNVHGKWIVYYRERGMRRDERVFSSEDEACCYLFELLMQDPTTRR
jgi:hypothetical protein